MVDTVRTIAYLLSSEFQDGQVAGSITPQDARDLIVSLQSLTTTIAINYRTAAYTLALSDAGLIVEMDMATAMNVTVPSNATIGGSGWPVGTVIQIMQMGIGQVNIVGGGVSIYTSSSYTTRAQWSVITLRQRAANWWVLSGDLT